MAGAPGNVEEPVSADIRVTPLGGGRFRLDDPAGSRIAYAAVEGSRTWVFVDGRTFVIADPDAPVRRTTEQDERAALSAPMPASVVDVRVAAGDRVESGDVLVMLEAMKMELPIRAPRDGVVTSVACRKGDLVQPGTPLVTLD